MSMTKISPKLISKMRGTLRQILREKFPDFQFKHKQEQAIVSALLGYDTFIQMPTAGGKSFCFQLTAHCDRGVTVVISPLVALIRDQLKSVERFKDHLPCAVYSSQASCSKLWDRQPDYKILYVTPEKAVKDRDFVYHLKELYQRNLLARFVVDEAHCINQWGNSFRPAFLHLGGIIQQFRRVPEKRVPVMALTASFSKIDCTKAIEYLNMDIVESRHLFWRSKLDRPNLFYRVIPKSKTEFNRVMKDFLAKPGSGIVYCLTVDECIETAKLVGENARPFYSGLSEKRKKQYQDMWTEGKVRVICATSAFGLGINKSDVRFVVHRSMPRSLAEYCQETGRAGRDGQSSECVLLYRFEDQYRILREIEEADCKQSFHKTKLNDLNKMVHYCERNCNSESAMSPYSFRKKCAREDRKVETKAINILKKCNEIGRVKLSDLSKLCAESDQNPLENGRHSLESYKKLIHRLVLSGHIRLFLEVNSYKRCTAYASLSVKGIECLKEADAKFDQSLSNRTAEAPCNIQNALSISWNGPEGVGTVPESESSIVDVGETRRCFTSDVCRPPDFPTFEEKQQPTAMH